MVKEGNNINLNLLLMKTKTLFSVLMILAISAGVCLAQGKQNKNKNNNSQKGQKTQAVQLFNGKDLKGWAFELKDPSIDPAKIFTVQNGVIHIKGDPFGYMRTLKPYSDYSLHVEWRYPGELSNSGVFIHAQMPDTVWPRCVECQLKSGNAADFVLMNGASMNEQTDKSKRVIAKMADSNEKPAGEWNSLDVTCKGNTIEVKVNGLLQNKGTGLNVSKGHICLQSEGKDVEFRNVTLTSLK